jgi:hypothetical protein
MAKKKEQEEKHEAIKITKLTPAQFHEWRSAIYEMQKADLHSSLMNAEYKLIQKDMELANLRGQVHIKNKIESSREKLAETKAEYDRIKLSIEEQIGYSLNDKVIDEISLEVKDLKK